MTPILYLASTIDTALAHMVGQIAATQREEPLARVQVLLPRAEVAGYVRRGLGNTLGVELSEFYGLGRAIVDASGLGVVELSDTALRRLVRRLLRGMHETGELSTFDAVWDKPGFTQLMLDWLREMKSQGIAPETVQADAARSGQERDRQLALLYTRYQDFLRGSDYSDADGLLWLAVEALEADPTLWAERGHLFVIGFDQVNPIQGRILGQLAARVDSFALYLPWDMGRAPGSLALTRLGSTRDGLRPWLAAEEVALSAGATAAGTLEHLRQNLFEIDAKKKAAPDQAALQLVAAPSREGEVRQALRRVKGLLLEGTPPHQVALLAPQPAAYAATVAAVAAEYGVPVQMDGRLDASPAVAALANLLGLYPEFPWRPTFDALHSPYVGQPWLTLEQLDQLDQLTRERPVVAGREQWAFSVRPLALEPPAAGEEGDWGSRPLVADLPAAELDAIAAGLMAFFDHVSPPPVATYRDYVLWLQEHILGLPSLADDGDAPAEPVALLALVARCQEGPNARRDLQALGQVMRLLRQLVEAAELVGDGDTNEVLWQEFCGALLELLPAAVLPADPLEDAVRFGPLEAGRAEAVDHLLVLGLAEGEFPAPPAADALYGPAERSTHPLPLRRPTPAEDASLWWQVLGNCRRSLTLLRPRFDDQGAIWMASPYWDAVADCFVDLAEDQPPAGAMPVPDACGSTNELLVALAAQGAAVVPEAIATAWLAAQRGLVVEQARQGRAAAGIYEGCLQAPDLVEELAGRYGNRHSWSVSRLNRYGMCPYGFFAETILGLEARPDPVEGFDPRQRGSLLHRVLELLYRGLAAEGLAPTTETEQAVLQRLDEACAVVFADAPLRYGFRPGSLWAQEQAELQRLLRALVVAECRQNGPAARFRPYLQEVRFGVPGGPWPALDLVDDRGTSFRLHGVIDRIDRDEAGCLRVVDYKSGSSTYSPNDIAQGLAMQTALYALAVEELASEAGRVVESTYLLIPARKTSGLLALEGGVASHSTVQAALSSAGRFVRRARAGIFPAAPGKPAQGGTACRDRCELAALCRVTRQSMRKARQASEADLA
jgi:ATP-dependent helicase/DNAse subunit B